MEHAAHHTRHTQQGKDSFGSCERGEVTIPKRGKHVAAYTTQEKRGSKRTTATTTAVGGRSSKDFHHENKCQIRDEPSCASIEEGIVEHFLGAAIEQELTIGNRVELVPVKDGARLYQVRRKELNKENTRPPA